MSNFCQFCDKELIFKESVVYEQGYITCGGLACTARAKVVSKEFEDAPVKQDTIKKANVLIFSSSDPEDVSSWRLVPQNIKNVGVMAKLVDGYVVNEENSGNFYCAKLKKDIVINQEALS